MLGAIEAVLAAMCIIFQVINKIQIYIFFKNKKVKN